MISDIRLASQLTKAFEVIGKIGVMAHWMEGLGNLGKLAGHSMHVNTGTPHPPRNVIPAYEPKFKYQFPLFERPPPTDLGEPYTPEVDPFQPPWMMGLNILFQGTKHPDLLSALQYASERMTVERAIIIGEAGYETREGDENSVASSPFRDVFLHTHGDGIALPSLPDLVSFFERYQHNPSYETFIYSKPLAGHEVGFFKCIDSTHADIWFWQDRNGEINARNFTLEIIPSSGKYPDARVSEVSLEGEVVSTHEYSARDLNTVGSEQEFWGIVLGQ